MAGIGSTAGSNDEELTVGGRAELQRWDGAALDSRGNSGGDTVWGGAGRVKKAMGGILGVRAAGIAARRFRSGHGIEQIRFPGWLLEEGRS